MSYVVRPISDRTPFEGKSRPSQFQSSWTATKELLLREVRALNGRDLVLELDFRESEIGIDGRPNARARAATPCVRVAFESMHGPLTYATDAFTTWQDNVRAIALGLEALRKFDRYGITNRGEQYTGWKALASGSGAGPSHMTADEARQILNAHAVNGLTAADSPEMHRKVWREARARAHPDRHEGDRTFWDQVEQAAQVLGISR